MSQEDVCLISVNNDDGISIDKTSLSKRPTLKIRRIRIVKNCIYLILLLDFLIHYALIVELGLFNTLRQFFTKSIVNSNATIIPLCHLPILEYIPYHLSDLILPIFCLSLLTLIISFEAINKSSLILYRFYLTLKCLKMIVFIFFYLFNSFANIQHRFLYSTITLSLIDKNQNENLLDIDSCRVYLQERMSLSIFSIVNVFIFCISIEFSSIVHLLRSKKSNQLDDSTKLHRSTSTLIDI